MLKKLIPLLTVAIVLGAGCYRNKRDQDVGAIKSNFNQFQIALTRNEAPTASTFVSSDLRALYAPEKIAERFEYVTNSGMQMTPDAYVLFDSKNKSRAWFYPKRPPAVGYGFIKETNAWKITLDVRPILDVF